MTPGESFVNGSFAPMCILMGWTYGPEPRRVRRVYCVINLYDRQSPREEA